MILYVGLFRIILFTLDFFVSFIYLIGLLIAFYKLKLIILKMIKNGELQESQGLQYIKGFQLFFIFVTISTISIVIEIGSH